MEVSAELEVGPKQVQRMVKRVDRKLDGVRQEKVREATLGLPAPWYASKHLAVAVDGSMIRFCDKEEDSISDWGEVKNAVVSSYTPALVLTTLRSAAKHESQRFAE